MFDIPEAHNVAVDRIAASVRGFYDRKQPFRLYHGSNSSTRPSQVHKGNMVDTSQLDRVLGVDTAARKILVEPNVPMDALVEATLAHNLLPPVVMEFPGITVGGGFAGTSGESSSFRYGYFDRTITRIQIVLGDGRIVWADREENADIFSAAASSFGTLGVVTALELGLIAAKPFVELTYTLVTSMKESVKVIEAMEDSEYDFVDAIVFSKTSILTTKGRLIDEAPRGMKVQGFLKASEPWHYVHARRIVRRYTSPVTEAVPIRDYLFRYDRGTFWGGMYSFRYFMAPFNRITRWILDGYFHTRTVYRAMHASGLAAKYIVQDVGIPYSRAEEFLDFLHTEFGFYPLWLCPLKYREPEWEKQFHLFGEKPDSDAPEMILNFGIYCPGSNRPAEFVLQNRIIEQKVEEFGGKKCLYARAYYTKDEFWQIFDAESYEAIREKCNSMYLPSVYDKVRVDFEAEERARNATWSAKMRASFWNTWPFGGLYGVYKATFGGEFWLRPEPVMSSMTGTKKEL